MRFDRMTPTTDRNGRSAMTRLEPAPYPTMTAKHLLLGFLAGFISVLTFQSVMLAIFHAAGAGVPFAPWSMAPVPPLGVPQSLSAAFWGGLWGVAYALLRPRLDALLGWWIGGLVFGALPLLALWFIVLPLKGLPLGGGFTPGGTLVAIVLHAVFGLGAAIVFRLAAPLVGLGPVPARG
jgi:hypothetical protein